MALMLTAKSPAFVKTTDCAGLAERSGWLAKPKLDVDKLTDFTPPVPLRLIDCGLPAASSVMFSDPEAAPRAVGEKEMLMVQLDPPARVEGQLFN